MQDLLDRLLEPHLGYTLSPWPTALVRTVQALAREEGLDPAAYLTRVVGGGDERILDRLLSGATIGHTSFRRHPEQLDYLQKVVLPTLRRRHGSPLRIWSAGCATGEEAYSIAACAELAAVPVEIVATDVNLEFLRIAREGRYPNHAARPLPLGDLDGNEWVAPESLRRRIRFERASLVDRSPALGLGPFHIVFCRNVLIYFRPEAVNEIVGRLLCRVERGGMLVVAPVEGVLSVPRPRLPHSPPGWFGVDAMALETAAPGSTAMPQSAARGPSSTGTFRRGAALPSPPAPRSAPPGKEPGHAERRPGVPPVRTPRRPISLLEAATTRLDCGDPEGAEELACLSLDRDPTSVDGWLLLGQLLLRRGEHTQARIAFLRAAEQAEDDVPDVA